MRSLITILSLTFLLSPLALNGQRLKVGKSIIKNGIEIILLAYEIVDGVIDYFRHGTVIIKRPGLNKISYGDSEEWFEDSVKLRLTWGERHSYFLSKNGTNWIGPFKVVPEWWNTVTKIHKRRP